jgi:hypothetical protein
MLTPETLAPTPDNEVDHDWPAPHSRADGTPGRGDSRARPATVHAQPTALRGQDIPPGLPLPGWDDLLVLTTA